MSQRLAEAWAELERLLTHGSLPAAQYAASAINCETVSVRMRDGFQLATDIYRPPLQRAPVVAMRTPYGRDMEDYGYAAALFSFARRGYVVVAQDCRGTGESNGCAWDYYMFEAEDSYDLVEWISHQSWFEGFIGGCGSSYVGQTQWCMATHPAMSAIAPSNSGLGIAVNTAHIHMFLNAYALVVGRGAGKVVAGITGVERMIEKETMAGGYFNEPLHKPFAPALLARFPTLREMRPSEAKYWMWEQYCGMTCAERAELVKLALSVENVTAIDVESLGTIFGHRVSHDSHTIPCTNTSELFRSIVAPPLLRTGWYDWGLNDALATWEVFRREARRDVGRRARLIITPYAHNMPGYQEGVGNNPELLRLPHLSHQVGFLLRWFEAIRDGRTDAWPDVIYYLMGANEWRISQDWPVPDAEETIFYLGSGGALALESPDRTSEPDHYIYDPCNPTPTMGGSIVSYVYRPGSVDVSVAQQRSDVLVYTTARLRKDLDVVGPLRMILYASSTSVDTDFAVRLSDVFPDGRAIQLQSGILRARYRNLDGEPEFLEPGRIYRLEIDMWATANRFKADHRMRIDISSADFPRFDRNSNRGGEPGAPLLAEQTIYHDAEYPSHLIVSVLNDHTCSRQHRPVESHSSEQSIAAIIGETGGGLGT